MPLSLTDQPWQCCSTPICDLDHAWLAIPAAFQIAALGAGGPQQLASDRGQTRRSASWETSCSTTSTFSRNDSGADRARWRLRIPSNVARLQATRQPLSVSR